jgi:hypothetical protein
MAHNTSFPKSIRYIGLFALIAVIAAVVGTTGQAHAQIEDIPSGASVVTSGAPPIIECKWELPDADSNSVGIQYGNDDDPLTGAGFPCDRGDGPTDLPFMEDNVQNVIQVLPNAEDLPEARKIENWVAVEHPNGVDEIDDVFWKVIHPDGSFKLQVHGTRVEVADLGDLGSTSTPGTMWYAAHETGQVTTDAVHTSDFGMIDLITQRQKDLWYAEWEISKDQMCGLYTIEVTAVASGAVATMTNTLDIQCFFNLEIDFESVDWGTISPGGTKVLPGDTNFGTADYPTIKNTGNSGMRVGIKFSELVQDDVLGPKIIDTFDAAFGKSAQVLEWIDPIPADTEVWFNNESINQVLCANQVGKLDLSVHPPSVVPSGTYSGTIIVLAEHAGGVCPNDFAHPY